MSFFLLVVFYFVRHRRTFLHNHNCKTRNNPLPEASARYGSCYLRSGIDKHLVAILPFLIAAHRNGNDRSRDEFHVFQS